MFFKETFLNIPFGPLHVQPRKRKKDVAAICAEVDILCAARSPHIVQLVDVHQKGLVFELGEALPTMVAPVRLKVIMEHCCRGARLNSRTQAHLSFHMQDKGSQTRPPNTSENTR